MEEAEAPPEAPPLPPPDVLPPDPDIWVEVVRPAALRVWPSRPSAAHAYRLACGFDLVGMHVCGTGARHPCAQ
eukprot:441208-Alexandrium_andersonii.AAC.1